jgi:hypothetical protein
MITEIDKTGRQPRVDAMEMHRLSVTNGNYGYDLP